MRWRTISCSLFLWLAIAAMPSRAAYAVITIEDISAIRYPTGPEWSPDSSQVAFVWDATGKQDIYLVTPGQPARQLTDVIVNQDTRLADITSLQWLTPDEIIYLSNGRLWQTSISSPGANQIGGQARITEFSLNATRTWIIIVQDDQLHVLSPTTGYRRQLTWLDDLQATTPVISLDAQWVAFLAQRQSSVQYPLPFNGNLLRSYVVASEERRLGIVSAQGSDVFWVPVIGEVRNVQFIAGNALLYEEISPDRKSREIKTVEVGKTSQTLWKDYDERFWSPHRRDSTIRVSPDGQQIAFISDRSGWMHLYVMPVDARSEKDAIQLTTGNHIAVVGSWSPDSRRLAYHHSLAENPMVRRISIADIRSGKSLAVVNDPGVNIEPIFSPDGTRVVYGKSGIEHSLDLYVVSADGSGSPVRLSNSMPDGFDTAQLTTPEYIEFPSRLDGEPVPATIIVHKDLDLTRRHPAIVWIHGSGADQNYIGWHPESYRMYYSMHQYLAQQGYIVLTPDYRGSTGYSRDWTTGHYMSIGVSDTADVASGADYLKTLDYVDPDRIGVWGLSYGGFMTLQTMWQEPELWRAGIDVAGVTEWANRGAGINLNSFTIPRLGSPLDNPEVYDVATPYKHVDRINKPLLIMHGTNDANVAFHDTLLLIDHLLKAGKDFETVVYPGETHFFRREYILTDAWRRVEKFFDHHLKDK